MLICGGWWLSAAAGVASGGQPTTRLDGTPGHDALQCLVAKVGTPEFVEAVADCRVHGNPAEVRVAVEGVTCGT